MTRLRVLVLLATFVFCPAVAHAQDDSWWAWIERLSGPGPFETKEVSHEVSNWELRLFCTSNSDDRLHFLTEKYGDRDNRIRRHCVSNTSDVNTYIAVRYQLLSTGNQNQFGEPSQRDIGFRALEGFVRYRVHPAVDVGSGLGFIWLTDKTNDQFGTQSRGEIIPLSFILRPGALLSGPDSKWKRFIGVRVDQAYRFGTITSEQLGGAPGRFAVDGEWSFRWALIADFGVLIP